MGTKVSVDGRFVTKPGVYTSIKSGISQTAAQNPYGAVCIIDDGTFGSTWGSGSGVIGTNYSGVSSVLSVTDASSLKSLTRGGQLYQLAKVLFKPWKNSQGVSKLFLIRASETTPSQVTITLSASVCILKTVGEGVSSVGVVENTNLTLGYAYKIISGSQSGKFQFCLYRGSYAGFDNKNGVEVNLSKGLSTPELVLKSPNLSSYSDLYTWMLNDAGFQTQLKLVSVDAHTSRGEINTLIQTSEGQTPILSSEISSSYVVFTGGTEAFTSNALDTALEASRALPINFYYGIQHGVNAIGTNNVKLFNFINALTGAERFMIVGGGNDNSTLFGSSSSTSQTIAAYYNSSRVIVVHGDYYVSKFLGGYLQFDSWYKTANILGRLCGLQPQIPLTFKAIPIEGETSSLSDKDQELAIDYGILCTYYNQELGQNVVLEDVNTLQDNQSVVTATGDSFLIQLKRIDSQLNKDLVSFMTKKFFGSEEGANRSTVNDADVTTATFDYLKTKTVDAETDNLIIWGGNVVVTHNQDNTNVSYQFQPNLENTKLIFNGLLVLEH